MSKYLACISYKKFHYGEIVSIKNDTINTFPAIDDFIEGQYFGIVVESDYCIGDCKQYVYKCLILGEAYVKIDKNISPGDILAKNNNYALIALRSGIRSDYIPCTLVVR